MKVETFIYHLLEKAGGNPGLEAILLPRAGDSPVRFAAGMAYRPCLLSAFI